MTFTTEQRDELLAFSQKHDLWLISDEVYDRIVFGEDHVSFMGTGYDKVMVVNSFSKTFAMTGWRIGYIISTNLEAMKQVVKIQYYISACSNDAMQYAVLEAMEQANDYPSHMAKEFQARCNLIVDLRIFDGQRVIDTRGDQQKSDAKDDERELCFFVGEKRHDRTETFS